MPERRLVAPGPLVAMHTPGPAGGAGVAFRREDAALLVAREDRADFRGFGQRLVDGHRRAARIGEDRVHTLTLQARDEDFRAVHDRPTVGHGGG